MSGLGTFDVFDELLGNDSRGFRHSLDPSLMMAEDIYAGRQAAHQAERTVAEILVRREAPSKPTGDGSTLNILAPTRSAEK